MNRIEQRLLTAGLLALTLHGVALSWQLHKDRAMPPTPVAVQRIAVSLGAREVAGEKSAEQKQVQHLQKKKEVLSPAKPVVLKTVQKKLQPQPKLETQRTVPFHEEQCVVQSPPSSKETPVENQPALEPVAPSPQTDMENESGKATPAAARVIRQASPLYQVNPPPKYPRLARRRGLEGIVLLEALVDISGRVAELRIFTSSGHPVLDQAALKAMRRWRFTPGTIGGNRQEMWVKVPIRYQLQ